MIIIKVELWPFGDESAAREIARGKIANDGIGDDIWGNYDIEFNGCKGHVKNHRRLEGIWRLIHSALSEVL